MAKAELYVKNGSSWVNYNLLNAYPVGSIYASGSSTSPATLFGGSWTQITNAALRGATSVGYIGSDSHALSNNEMPSHSHKFKSNRADSPLKQSVVVGDISKAVQAGESFWTVSGNVFDVSIDYTGGGQHIPMCNAPTTVICGNAKTKSPRGDVAWPTSTLDKLCTQLEHISSQTIQSVLQHYLEELGQLLMREDSSVPQVVDMLLAHKVELLQLLCQLRKCLHIHINSMDIKMVLEVVLSKVPIYVKQEISTMVGNLLPLPLVQHKHMKTDHYTGPHTYGEEQTNLALGCDV